MKIVNQTAAMRCIEYILEHEVEDFQTWHLEAPECHPKHHIYYQARKAIGKPITKDEFTEE